GRPIRTLSSLSLHDALPILHLTLFFDQSLFVRAAIQGVLREALIAACLTAVMILLFLGNWKSTFIIAISIPLSILVSVICLSARSEEHTSALQSRVDLVCRL